MLRPTKHSHPDKTIMYISYILLKHIKEKRLDSYEALKEHVKVKTRLSDKEYETKNTSSADFLFVPALSFLYILGLIEYRPKTDSIEYVGPNEAF